MQLDPYSENFIFVLLLFLLCNWVLLKNGWKGPKIGHGAGSRMSSCRMIRNQGIRPHPSLSQATWVFLSKSGFLDLHFVIIKVSSLRIFGTLPSLNLWLYYGYTPLLHPLPLSLSIIPGSPNMCFQSYRGTPPLLQTWFHLGELHTRIMPVKDRLWITKEEVTGRTSICFIRKQMIWRKKSPKIELRGLLSW